MAKRGRPSPICPDVPKLRELSECGAMQSEMMRHFAKGPKTIKTWLTKHGLALRVVIPDLPSERWLSVVGWEGCYEVSDQGRIKSLPRLAHDGTPIHGRLRALDCMTGRTRSRPYWQVHLMRGGRDAPVYRAKVHRLVMEAFVGPCPEGMEILHINGNGFDNRLDNLRYDTHKANMAEQLQYDRSHRMCRECGAPVFTQ